MAQIAIHHNPFHLHQNVDLFEPRIGQTVRGWLDERGITEFSKPTLCLVDGEPVLRKDWALVVITKDTVVSFIGERDPARHSCNNCRACVESCPVSAIFMKGSGIRGQYTVS